MSRKIVILCYTLPAGYAALNLKGPLAKIGEVRAKKEKDLLLQVDNLNVFVDSPRGRLQLLTNINLSLEADEVFAVIGESGSGKTTLARALTKLFPKRIKFTAEGKVQFGDRDLLSLNNNTLLEIRKKLVRYIFQEPASVLNPVARIRSQLRLILAKKDGQLPSHVAPSDESLQEALAQAGIKNPGEVLDSYPHQLSVGTLQRILIAIALFPRPRLLIADEPTSALDASVQSQILELLQGHCKVHSMSMLLITHDLHIARRYADKIAVLYAGRVLEIARSEDFFIGPLHPYSQMLLASTPSGENSIQDMPYAPGGIPSIEELPTGCKFHPRCYKVQEDCAKNEPQLFVVEKAREVRCPYWK